MLSSAAVLDQTRLMGFSGVRPLHTASLVAVSPHVANGRMAWPLSSAP